MSEGERASKGKQGGDVLKLAGPALLLVLAGFALAYLFVDPAPPSRLVMATGEQGGAYAAFGAAYRDRLALFEIELVLRESAGSRASLTMLEAGEVDVAFVQGGVATPEEGGRLETLGSLYFEPLWLFHRDEIALERLTDLRGRRIAIGPPGSGTASVARDLLSRNGIDEGLRDGGIGESVDALVAGEIDAAFMIAAAESTHVRRLLEAEGISLYSFRRADAYVRTHRYLSKVVLPEGMIDYARNIPDRDIDLIAPTANLVVASGLHPALIDLLVQSADTIHGGGSVFGKPAAFPTPEFIDLPLNVEAARFYEYGPPLLQRYLPFWLATLVDRLKVMLIPLVALLIPVFRLFPPIYRWRVRSRIYRWYTELREIDPRNRQDFDLEQAIAESQRIEREVGGVDAPPSYGEELYQLRLHVDFVQKELTRRSQRRQAGMPEDPEDEAEG